MLRDHAHYRTILHLPDFGPASQDKWAVQLLSERGAIPDNPFAVTFDVSIAHFPESIQALGDRGHGHGINRKIKVGATAQNTDCEQPCRCSEIGRGENHHATAVGAPSTTQFSSAM